ncbi:imidazoleglycerol-phosphate dehydratase HisB [Blautia liquoris]|uniref:Imidazoleglycerol-phosphate dehydratase n=1 Tax=Blautia liquoris TaxID=2779518 RepID=A0A7M2RJY5_9FIRM|nr:imidazoleglycerol-phosphate dehydratase HisB [Blautia liquoris]QOV19877.1 imidazoleglycerol-phosphate dehydratase HisB [Blautia liquoris]
MRETEYSRRTSETNISLTLVIEGSGKYDIHSGCGFLDHMLELFTRHGRFDLKLTCEGDTQVDYHHTTEDIGICLGEAFARALGEKRGISRYGSMLLPMDEALILCAVDLSGRDLLIYDAVLPTAKVGDFDTELVEDFMLGFSRTLRATIHIRQISGKNSHHIIEAMFKALGHAMKGAAAIDPEFAEEIPSTKGIL